MLWIWTSLALAAGPAPRVVVDWAGDSATVEVWAPLGIEFAEDAPATLDLRWSDASVHWESTGAALNRAIHLGGLRGETLDGRLAVSMCDKSDGSCVPRTFALEGWTADKRKGQAVLTVAEASDEPMLHEGAHAPEFQTDASALAGAAFAAAKVDGKRVLLDFGAVWCPPCNLLTAEVLHAPEPPPILEDFHIAMLDVDDPSSFELKSRYDVGGYPTLVIVEPDGTEVTRQVGYPGREEMVDWLVRASEQEGADTDFSQVDPASITPEEAAEIAWLLVQDRSDAAQGFIDRAGDLDVAALRLARVTLDPNLDDARWLADNAPGTAIDWVYPAKGLAETDEGRLVLRRALEADLHGTKGTDASDLLYLLAETASEADQPLLYAASAASLRGALTGDPVHDKGHLTWLAVLTERSGDGEGALELLEDSAARWPEEPTFHLAQVSHHLRQDQPEQALVAADAALRTSWGDNKLRAAAARCEALTELGRDEEAAEQAAETLAEIPAPEEGLQVRTFKYREKLQKWADGQD